MKHIRKVLIYISVFTACMISVTNVVMAGPCTIPPSGTWTVTEDCTLEGGTGSFIDYRPPGDVVIQSPALLTIEDWAALKLQFGDSRLDVQDGAGILINPLGKIESELIPVIPSERLNDMARRMRDEALAAAGGIVTYPFTFLVIGDSRRNDPGGNMQMCIVDDDFEAIMEQVKAQVLAANSDPGITDIMFMFNVGDFVQGSKEEEYYTYYKFMSNWMTEAGIPFFSLPGNHELYTGGYTHYGNYIDDKVQVGGNFNYFDYTEDYGNCRFVMLNNIYHNPPGATTPERCDTSFNCPGFCIKNVPGADYDQVGKIESWITTSQKDNTFTFMHSPIQSERANATGGSYCYGGLDNCEGYRDMRDVFMTTGVDISFAGHDHAYYHMWDENATGEYHEMVINGGGEGSDGTWTNPPMEAARNHWILVTVQDQTDPARPYNLKIEVYFRDEGHSAEAEKFDFIFDTAGDFSLVVPDTIPPDVKKYKFTEASTADPQKASISTNINTTFTEIMVDTTINDTTILLKDSLDNPVAGTVSYLHGATTATFDPAADLNYGETYTMVITTGVQDKYGNNNMQAEDTWEFTTEDAP